MSKNRSQVRIESPKGSETHNLRGGESLTVKTTQEKPEVTGGIGGFPLPIGGLSDGAFLAGALFALVIALMMVCYAIVGIDYVIETYVIKGICPSYQTSFEKSEAKEAKRKSVEAFFGKEFGGGWAFARTEIATLDEEIIATTRISQDDNILARSFDDGETWTILLTGTRNRGTYCFFHRPAIYNTNGKIIIQAALNYGGTFKAQTEDDGETWEFYDQNDREVTPTIKNGKVVAYP